MTHFRTLALALAPLSLLHLAVPVAASTPEALAAPVSQEADSGAFMGAVLVVKRDEVLLDRAWGSANLELDVANTTQTKFRIGSVTKQFTAVSILLLQERGELSLGDSISEHLSDAPEAWAEITIRDLLQHTSGVPNVTSLDGFGRLKYLPTSQDDLIATFIDLPLEFAPGSAWAYSNSNYVLLSRIVEAVGGVPYAEFISTNLLEPAGMSDTAIDVTATIVPNRASGYSPSSKGIVNADYVDMGIPTGAGALYSTTADLFRWQRSLFGGEILSTQSLSKYVTPSAFEMRGTDKYGLGVIVENDEDGRSYYHGGGIEGFNAWLGYDPDLDVTVVVLANLNGGTAARLGEQLLEEMRK